MQELPFFILLRGIGATFMAPPLDQYCKTPALASRYSSHESKLPSSDPIFGRVQTRVQQSLLLPEQVVVYLVPASGCSLTSENFKLTLVLTIANSVYVMDTESKRYHTGLLMSLIASTNGVTDARKTKKKFLHGCWC